MVSNDSDTAQLWSTVEKIINDYSNEKYTKKDNDLIKLNSNRANRRK